MGVRDLIPDSIAFVVTVQIASHTTLRVRVLVDLSNRLLFLPAGILPEIDDRLDAFIEQLGELTACQLALVKWDGADGMTEYCELQILPNYQMQRVHVRFAFVLQPGAVLSVEELAGRSSIQLTE